MINISEWRTEITVNRCDLRLPYLQEEEKRFISGAHSLTRHGALSQPSHPISKRRR